MSYVLNSCLGSVTHTWGKACLMSQPSNVEQHSTSAPKTQHQGENNHLYREQQMSYHSEYCFSITQKEFHLPPHTHTHLLHMDSKQKYLLSIQGLGSPGDQTRQEEPGYRAQLYGRSTREMRLSLESSAKSCKMRQEKGYIHNLRRYF